MGWLLTVYIGGQAVFSVLTPTQDRCDDIATGLMSGIFAINEAPARPARTTAPLSDLLPIKGWLITCEGPQ